MSYRNLVVLRIDDVRGVGDVVESNLLDDFTAVGNGEIIHCINGLHASMKVWGAYQWERMPDIVISDVLFQDDDSTPLSRGIPWESYPNPIPTGLCHLKPFAALAFSKGALMGIGLHTSTPEVWQQALGDGHPMGLLAAHEIGEIAAILGDCLLTENVNQEQLLTQYWRWLDRHHSGNYSTALHIALTDYRKKLVTASRFDDGANRPRIMVPPHEWVKLEKWREEHVKSPAPIGTDVGIELALPDGSRDRIRLASLFADIDDIDTLVWPAECFEAPVNRTEDEPWKKDVSNRPRFGAFIKALDSTHQLFAMATKIVHQFPIILDAETQLTQTISDAAGRHATRNLALGIAVLFQAARWENRKRTVWLTGLSESGWNPRDKELCIRPCSTEVVDAAPLKERLLWIFEAAKQQRGDSFYCGDILGEGLQGEPLWPHYNTRSSDAEWVIWHFNLLASAGALQRVGDYEYKVISNDPPALKDYRCPEKLPTGFAEKLDFEVDITAFLKNSLGFGMNYMNRKADDDNGIGRIISRAFLGLTDGTKGREYLKRILRGSGPVWIRELVREFARNTQGTDERSWPTWIRGNEHDGLG